MITGIHHVAISVPDLDKAVSFYHEILGFEKDFPIAGSEIESRRIRLLV